MPSTSHAENLSASQDPTQQHPVSSGSRSVLQGISPSPMRRIGSDARLSLGFVQDGDVTRLTHREHYGQLVVQKPFYPEGREEACQVIVVHPPGGIMGGDRIEIAAQIGAGARAQLTTPGAAKWYKANGHPSHQDIKLNVEAGAVLEWVPQETIFYDNADVTVDHNVTLEKDARYIGCEVLCFGRTAHGESFNGGRIRQRIGIRRDNKLIWFEQMQLAGGGPAMTSPLMLAGRTVCATLVAAGEPVPASLIHAAREGADAIMNGAGSMGVTQLKSVVVARYLGDSSEIARRIMLHVWGLLRPAMLGRPAVVPRIWET